MRTLRIGTRGSELALAQTRLAIAALQQVHPGLQCEYIVISTPGDQRTDIPLHQVNAATGTGDKGVFIATIEEALAAGEIDCAVHSLKDMPGVLDARFCLAAVLPREDIRDALVYKPGVEWAAGATVATGSVRRMHLVHSRWQGLVDTVPVRGNVATRLRKLVENPEVQGTLLARAGLNRLGYGREEIVVDGCRLGVEILSPDEFAPALGQGAIALETRRDDAEACALVSAVNDVPTSLCIRCEREFLRLLQADCSVPVGGYALCTPEGGISLSVVYYRRPGDCLRVQVAGGSGEPPESVAARAHAVLQQQL
ncbi:MAG: hydroxymethylbilane synthase [Akkermansia sp.]|nr:hydroxymethylbilane synthase [Akkermansia sp.]